MIWGRSQERSGQEAVAEGRGVQRGRNRRREWYGGPFGLLPLALAISLMAAPLVNASEESVEGASAEEPEEPTRAEVFMGPDTGIGVAAGSSRVSLHGYAWLRAESQTRVGDETDLEASVPVARLFMTGNLLDSKLGFFAQAEFAGSQTELLDLFAEWNFHDAFRLRLGQFRTPFSRAFITPLTNLELPTRGLIVDRFNLGRDTGGMASGDLCDGFFHYDLAIVNGARINDQDGNRDAPSVIGRTEFRFGDPVPYDQAPSLSGAEAHGVTIGLGGAYSRRAVEGAAGTSTEQLSNATMDIALMHGPLHVQAEGFWRSAHGSPRVSDAFGAYAQAGYFVVPRRLELGGRAGWLTDGPDVQTYEAFLAGYGKLGDRFFGHHLKVILAYRYDSAGPPQGSQQDRHTAQVQTQLFF